MYTIEELRTWAYSQAEICCADIWGVTSDEGKMISRLAEYFFNTRVGFIDGKALEARIIKLETDRTRIAKILVELLTKGL